jgi:hypothetical protein
MPLQAAQVVAHAPEAELVFGDPEQLRKQWPQLAIPEAPLRRFSPASRRSQLRSSYHAGRASYLPAWVARLFSLSRIELSTVCVLRFP